jgi:hypothetical protein
VVAGISIAAGLVVLAIARDPRKKARPARAPPAAAAPRGRTPGAALGSLCPGMHVDALAPCHAWSGAAD